MIIGDDAIEGMRQRLGPVGVWLGPLAGLPAPEEQAAARRVEELGYGSIWAGEAIVGKEAFAHQALLLAATERIVAGSGIANVWARQPASMVGGAYTLGSAWPGRFILGVGISHAPLIDRIGLTYDKPLAHMAHYLEGMDDAVPAAPVPEVPVPTVVAALRPQMLALARDHTDGAHPYFVPVSHTPLARAALGPGKLLIPEQAVVLSVDPAEARAMARDHMKLYLQLPNYVNNLRHLGYVDADFAEGGSDHLVDDIVAWGDETAVANRVHAHLDGGADHVVIQPLGTPGRAMETLERLSGAMLR